ncbi:MATE family efflux transporter [Nocardioides sp. CFH 31398]|uniref:MATE family efflux transporter n=1 Tax=Nocardioides sp. CFH 31398 TaxID=2919579 RepID=UPI001F056D24|nr:MATE family efflux transporter [Nocardioides sp. CFH 31398]MCH1865737.1 MATE family efflux transporter [Nocardioides sp. CFH 31398]
MSRAERRTGSRRHDREIVRLAFPAFLALVAEPLYLLADAAVVGNLGTAQLAGLGVAAVVLQTVVGLCVFLAYGTTATVARRLGAGDRAGALSAGVDGLWLAVALGVVLTVVGLAVADPVLAAFGASPAVTGYAEDYLRPALLGVTPLLVVLAGTGVLRGLQDTRTPLVVAIVGNLLNVVLNVVLVYGLGPVPALGIAGAALGSVVAQALSALVLLLVVVRAARRARASLRPRGGAVLRAARDGVPLLVRTLTLRASLLVTTYAVTLGAVAATAGSSGGDVELATHQLAMTLWTFTAFVLDAVAIAAQAITGRYLGAGDVAGTRDVTRRMVTWGVWSGVVTGLLLALAAPLLGPLFTPDPAVRDLLVPVLLVAALAQPLAGVVFVLDGVLIGAGDGRYLAWGGLVVLLAHAPVALLVAGVGGGVVATWVVFVTVFMGGRAVVLLHRARGTAWLVTGAGTPGRGL